MLKYENFITKQRYILLKKGYGSADAYNLEILIITLCKKQFVVYKCEF
jgi:hypothetical protein